jgi:nucleotide-binding universal stress UspA family protein
MSKYGILAAVDGSAESDAAVRWAATEAKTRRLPLTLMHAIVPVVVTWPIRHLEAGYRRWQEDHAELVIDLATQLARAECAGSNLAVQNEIRHDGAAAALIGASRAATMVAVGSRGFGAIGAGLLGSVSRGLLHYARCPVAVVRAAEDSVNSTRPVLLGIDGSPASEAATALAFDEASRREVDLVALHAWSNVSPVGTVGPEWSEFEREGGEVLAERLAGWHEKYPDVKVQRRIVCDRAAQWLIEESARAQLVVLGSHGRGGITRMLLGSVSTTVAESSKTPVIVVRGESSEARG